MITERYINTWYNHLITELEDLKNCVESGHRRNILYVIDGIRDDLISLKNKMDTDLSITGIQLGVPKSKKTS